MVPHTLYLCYFGLREPLVQTQVLPYLRQLVAGGIAVSIVTFEPALRKNWSSAELEAARARLAAEGLQWYCLPYHKRPTLPATLYDVLAGARLASRLIRKNKIDFLHARGHVPALMGAIAKRLSGGRLIFDIRGFMPEEYTDAGIWPANGYLYRGVKVVERQLFKFTDAFVLLTEKAREALFPFSDTGDGLGRPIEVIPCCVDPERFCSTDAATRDDLRQELKLIGKQVIVYVGSFGGWYLTDEMIQFLAQAHRQDPNTFAMILTQSPGKPIEEKFISLGIPKGDFFIGQVSPAEVPRYLKAADFAISFIKPCYSKISSSPTKIAEYLASGLPVLSNAGIGDLDDFIARDRIGVIIRGFGPADFSQALTELSNLKRDPSLPARCQTIANERFNLRTVGGRKYLRLYQRLLLPKAEATASALAQE